MPHLVVHPNFSLPKSLTNLIKQDPPTTPYPVKPIVPRRSLRPSCRCLPLDPHTSPLSHPPHPSLPPTPPLSPHNRPLKHGHNPQRGRQPRQPRHRKRRRHPRPRRPGGRDSGPGPGPTGHQRRPIGAHALPAIGPSINAEKCRANRRPETELRAPPRELIPTCQRFPSQQPYMHRKAVLTFQFAVCSSIPTDWNPTVLKLGGCVYSA